MFVRSPGIPERISAGFLAREEAINHDVSMGVFVSTKCALNVLPSSFFFLKYNKVK